MIDQKCFALLCIDFHNYHNAYLMSNNRT